MRIKNSKQVKKIMNLNWIFLIILLLLVIGGAMNLKAVMNNQGRMPVHTGNYINTEKHFSFQDFNEIKSDLFVDRLSLGRLKFSIGDIFLVLGLISFISLQIYIIRLNIKDKKREKKNEFSN